MNSKGRYVVFDIEATAISEHMKSRKDLHIIHAKDIYTGEKWTFFDPYHMRVNAVKLGKYEELASGTLEDGVKFLLGCNGVSIHNGSGFDWLAFEQAFPELMENFDYFAEGDDPLFPWKVMDTCVLSRTLQPERRLPEAAFAAGAGAIGAHTIEAHGYRMKRKKPEHEDWTKLDLAMFHRVSEDVEIAADLHKYLMREYEDQKKTPNKVTGMSIKDAYYCEHRMAFAMARQQWRGFRLDMGYASSLLAELDKELEDTENLVRPMMPKRVAKSRLSFSQAQKEKAATVLDEATYKEWLQLEGSRGSASATKWLITAQPTDRGRRYYKNVTAIYPEAIGYIEDHKDPLVVGAFTPIVWQDIPLGNREEVKELLYKYGWFGVNFNDKEVDHNDTYNELLSMGRTRAAAKHGKYPYPWSGKIDEVSMERWRERDGKIPDWAEGIARWYIISSRRNQILNAKDVKYYEEKGYWANTGGVRRCKGLMAVAVCSETRMTGQEYYEKHGFFPDEGEWRVPAKAFHTATPTHRMRHRNVVNIPSRGLYGKHMRKLFIASEGCNVVGCDGSGLEIRMQANYMKDPEFTKVVLHGDIHNHNMELGGYPSRDKTKTGYYAFVYGASIPAMARSIGVSEAEMRAIIDRLSRTQPKLMELVDSVRRVGEARGFLISFDGRRGYIRKDRGKYKIHTALNVLLQMAGSVLMKWGHILAEDLAVKRGLIKNVRDFPILAHQHDEAQMEENKSLQKEMCYTILKGDWKAEEKREHVDDTGTWSAPEIVGETDDELVLKRYFSPLGQCYADGIRMAGELLKLEIPTAGEYKVGKSWLETH